ncbi:MAG: anhydro-N-acetylmuramic acid kinase [Alphaproteobacteria bacterium]|nr:anhydro-N-acetylmuramic acid kinase [Alphaproteobacteria bacterium]HRW29205.1 anhydro-N-acetylmuramic acid kinase [Emcibacteraceae bacterium]
MKNGNAELTAIGLMSGTSLDGIDAALIKSDGQSIKRFGRPFHMTYSRGQRDQLKAALKAAREAGRPTSSNNLINETEQLITALHAEVIRELLKQNNLETHDVDVIGFHGQTLLHGPDDGWSWQIGDGRKLAEMLEIQVVNDLRRNDVEHGGQGAPMVPVYHQAIVRDIADSFPVGLINFGGVANITWIGGRDTDNLLAFDTGPANALLDDWIRKHTDYIYDQDGMFSKKGTVHREILSEWMKNKYFEIKPPKSLDRDDFNVDEVNELSLEDGAATLAAFSVEALKVASGQCPEPVKKWYVCGGGAHNPTIMKMLEDALACDVRPISDLGFNGDFIEAEAFAYLAVRHLYNLPITFPGTTGISKPSTGGILNKP